MVCVNRLTLTTLTADRQTVAECNKLISRMAGHFEILKARDHVMTIDGNEVANTIAIGRAAPFGFQHRHRLLE